MKKLNILIAVFTVLATASIAKADGVDINFDSNKGAPKSFTDLIAAAPIPTPPSNISLTNTESGLQSDHVFYKLEKSKQQALASASSIHGLGSKIELLIQAQKTDILYNNTAVYFVSKDGKAYTTLFKSTDERLVAVLLKSSSPAQQAKNAIFCKFVEMVLWELVKGVWTEVIKQVKECYSESDDTETPTPSNPGSGGPISWPVRYAQVR